MLKKFVLILIFLFVLSSCGSSTDNTNQNPNVTKNQGQIVQNSQNINQTNSGTSNEQIQNRPLENKFKEIKHELIKDFPDWVKEMNIISPKDLIFIDANTREVSGIKGVSAIYGGTLEQVKKSAEEMAKKAGLIDSNAKDRDSLDSIVYSNANPLEQGTTLDKSKYIKSITIRQNPTGEIIILGKTYKVQATMLVDIFDTKFITGY